MTDPQLSNNNNNNSSSNNNNNSTSNNNNNNNNDGEPKYLHKKFKKMATTEVATPKLAEPMAEQPREGEAVAEVLGKKDCKETGKTEMAAEVEGEPTEGRKNGYVCPYCKLSCAKPSVLQKHIRAHTNERPYPCVPCGFAFKTKSNLYKHCRSRAHALKMEGGDVSKVSEDSDISLSDSASNGTGTPPPAVAASSAMTVTTATLSTKTVKTGKIYKPKFHTALQCVANEETTTSSSSSSASFAMHAKPNAEQLQEHIDKIITDNQAIVEAVDPRLHKLMQRQQSLTENKQTTLTEQPLNLSTEESFLSPRKRSYSESFNQENGKDAPRIPDSSIIKDLLLKTCDEGSEIDSFVCPSCRISYNSADNLEAHRRYYCKGSPSPRRADFQLDLDKRETDLESKSDYYNGLQPLPSPGPLLGNTRLVDAYASQPKKLRPESVPTSLRSLEELSKYPRPNSLQMFGGEVRILDTTGETKTMRIEPRLTNSPSPNEQQCIGKCFTSETASVVVRSGLHSGGTMVHKPPPPQPPTGLASTPSSSISLANTPQMLAPIVPNISTPNIAPAMSCYNYLEPHLNPLTSITAYNPLTLPQAGIASILHGGKVIPYVPGMPGPHSLSDTTSVDIPPNIIPGDASYKVIPGIPGLHMVQPQPLDLASPVKMQPGQPLDLASPAKEVKPSFKTPCSDTLRVGMSSPKVSNGAKLETSEKYRCLRASSSPIDQPKSDVDRHVASSNTPTKCVSYKGSVIPSDGNGLWERKEHYRDLSPKIDSNGVTDSNIKSPNSFAKVVKFSPRVVSTENNRKRPSNWSVSDMEAGRNEKEPSTSPVSRNEIPVPVHENWLLKSVVSTVGSVINSSKVNMESAKSESPGIKTSSELSKSSENLKLAEDGSVVEVSSKFLRPTSLPLKPGTFTPKKHHGITPTTNTLPLISPETPRPKKSYGQLYLNGHAYTYLGLKCSTRLFYCTLNRPQPMYVTQQHALSMYSNWKICNDSPPDSDMANYDSRHRPLGYTVAWKKWEDILTHSSHRPTTPASPDSGLECDTQEKTKRVKIFDGGFESNEDYTYVRGRGRGRYVCEECGIRCKKPSMLKKHIRTHTDVRPYTCKHCAFSFKTKGNLTKHMKSKAHYKKCVELGIVPVPTTVCDENIDKDAIARLVAGGGNAEQSSSEEEESEGDESDESGSEEQEAAQGLLSLSQPNSMSNLMPGLLPSGRPSTYPYTLSLPSSASVTMTSVVATTTLSALSSSSSTQVATLIQNEVSNRYYFPSNRNVMQEDSRTNIMEPAKKCDDSDVETEDFSDARSRSQAASQPMDLTTKQIIQSVASPIHQRAKPADILTPVSEPVLLQTLVQTMERLPIQGSREWKPDAEDGHMLQAYLTERHVMDSKIKQQYRVGNSKMDKHGRERESYLKQHGPTRSNVNGVPTVTYTDPTKMHQSCFENKARNVFKQIVEDVKMETREKVYQNKMFDLTDKDSGRLIPEKEIFPRSSSLDYGKSGFAERSSYSVDLPRSKISELESAKKIYSFNSNTAASNPQCDTERSVLMSTTTTTSQMLLQEVRESKIPSPEMRMTSESMTSDLWKRVDMLTVPGQMQSMQNSTDLMQIGQEFKTPNQDMRKKIELLSAPGNDMHRVYVDVRPPSRDARIIGDYRQEPPKSFELIQSGARKSLKLQDIPVSRSPQVPEQRGPNNVDSGQKNNIDNVTEISIKIKHSVARKMVVGSPGFRPASPTNSSNGKPQAIVKPQFLQNSSTPAPNYVSVTEDGRSVCGICNKVFSKSSQLKLHINIHYFERPFKCESCGVSFRTKGHLTKHERSVSHHNKVSMTSTFGAATTSNPRPFKCPDCKIAFRIHGHLAKHLRSKMHIMRLECLGKLPFGIYAEMERSGVNLNDIDTTDCDNSLTSLQILAQKLYEKDPSKMGPWDAEMVRNQSVISGGETSSDEGEPIHSQSLNRIAEPESANIYRPYNVPILVNEELKSKNDVPQIPNSLTPSLQEPNDTKVPSNTIENSDTSGPIKCQMCELSFLSLSDLQMHNFIDHNADANGNKENNTRKIIDGGGRDNDSRCKSDDT